jgi:vesicle transport through interaction with t-SNAREs protein 1
MDVDDPADFSTASQRTRLLASSATLGTTSNRLDNAHRTALETEDIGEGIMGSLRGQREQLEGTRDMLGEADSSIGKATGTLKRMIRK